MKKFLSAFLSLAVALSLTALPASALELEAAKTLLQTYYVDPLPDEIWSLGSLDEILEAIGDPYTVYMNTEEYQAFLSSVNGDTVVGIGASVETPITTATVSCPSCRTPPPLRLGWRPGTASLP